MTRLASGSWPLCQRQVWVPSHGVDLKSSFLEVVGDSPNICATIPPVDYQAVTTVGHTEVLLLRRV